MTNIPVGNYPKTFNLTSYPISYPPFLDCNWKIIALAFGSTVHIGISDFSTEDGKDIAVLKGINLYGETVSFVLTGSVDKLLSVALNSSHEVTFNFRSDAYFSGRGFLLDLYSSNGKFSYELFHYIYRFWARYGHICIFPRRILLYGVADFKTLTFL